MVLCNIRQHICTTACVCDACENPKPPKNNSSLTRRLKIRHVLCGETFFTASRRLFKPHSNGLSWDCVNSPSAIRSSKVLARTGVAMTCRGATTRARALSAFDDAPPFAHFPPSDAVREVATAWMRVFLWTHVGAAEATGIAADIMMADRTHLSTH